MKKTELTLSILKPDAIRLNLIGPINHRIRNQDLRIVAIKMLKLTRAQAEGFYAEHQSKPFFNSLIDFMTSGPVVVQVLSGEHAISTYRELMGDTNPGKAAPKTLRADFAMSIEQNAVHGSDSPESAEREIAYFFKPEEIFI